MEPQKPEILSQHPEAKSGEFQPGSTVIYGLHGRCTLISIEQREVSGQKLRFYRLELQKSPLSRSSRKEPAIMVPVESARERGLRAPMNKEEAEAAIRVLASREYYFELTLPWATVLPKLENTARTEGAIGLAKVASYLYVLKRKQLVPSAEVNRMQESIWKMLLREITDAIEKPAREVEDQINRGLRQKLLPDT